MVDSTAEDIFPDALIRWSGHHAGAVRRPFHKTSGRPTGKQIQTPLIERLNIWIDDLVAGRSVPRAVLLVGGPGNGKTDAVEGAIERLDVALRADGRLTTQFTSAFAPGEGSFAPRKVVVDLSVASSAIPAHMRCSVSLVQDASEGDPSENATAVELLLRDLQDLIEGPRNEIYICCVNRGILAEASNLAHERLANGDAANLIDRITRAVTTGPDSPSCWPLEGFPGIAVWPMDMESLVVPSGVDGRTVAHQIFEIALDESRWRPPCELNTRCPFCHNRTLLSRRGSLDSLIRLLHFYELSSGKRWTFRDLFSLVPYLLVGDYDELTIKGQVYSPCGWAAEQRRLAQQGALGSADRDRAVYLLASRLYHHRLFPRWPTFDSGDYWSAKRELLKDGQLDRGLDAARAFFRHVAKAHDSSALAKGEVPDRVRQSLGPVLDPSIATGENVLFVKDGAQVTVEAVEDAFSLSVKNGLDLVGSHVETLEKDVLADLAQADGALAEDNFPGNRVRQARLLQLTVRQYATRMVKRSLGTRKGVCRDNLHFGRYVEAVKTPSVLNQVRRQLRQLLHDAHDKFRAPLATTFGQPVAERSRDVAMVLPRTVSVHPLPQDRVVGRPPEHLPYFRIDRHVVALTFDLFRALEDVSQGLHAASLPSEIYSLLDRVKSLVAGHVVRDPDVLADEPRIVIGSSQDIIEYVNGRFHYVQGDRR
jgi:hypothetical protein